MRHEYFKQKTILITGAASGVGRALSFALSEHAETLVLIDRNVEELTHVEKALGRAKVRSLIIDLSKSQEVHDNLIPVLENVGKIDIIFHCAGITKLTFIKELNTKLAFEVMECNYNSFVNICVHSLPKMIESNSGHIVALSSMAGVRGLVRGGYYSASKAALNNFLESIRIDLFKHRITVTSVTLGFVDTPMNAELKKFYRTPWMISPEKAAEIVLKGVSKRRKTVYSSFGEALLTFVVKILPTRTWLRLNVRDTFNLEKPNAQK